MHDASISEDLVCNSPVQPNILFFLINWNLALFSLFSHTAYSVKAFSMLLTDIIQDAGFIIIVTLLETSQHKIILAQII